MTRLTWASTGKRTFETGIDRGVLYVAGSAAGVEWNGLISVSEAPSGGDITGYYMDGVKYLNVAASTEYEATIKAYSSPPEFAACEGVASLNGLMFADQPKKSFGLSYRTRLGNDLVGTDYGYKLHIVYNALAETPSRDYSTVSDSPDAVSLSWPVKTKPITIAGRKPTAHLVIDSTTSSPADVSAVEDILYGTAGAAPRLPTSAELITLFS